MESWRRWAPPPGQPQPARMCRARTMSCVEAIGSTQKRLAMRLVCDVDAVYQRESCAVVLGCWASKLCQNGIMHHGWPHQFTTRLVLCRSGGHNTGGVVPEGSSSKHTHSRTSRAPLSNCPRLHSTTTTQHTHEPVGGCTNAVLETNVLWASSVPKTHYSVAYNTVS